MALATHIVRRGSTYYFRARVPAALKPRIGRAELSRSLQTASAPEARRRATYLASLTMDLWQALERAMTIDDVRQLIQGWLRQALDTDAKARDELDRLPLPFVVTQLTEPHLPDAVVKIGQPGEDWRDHVPAHNDRPPQLGDLGLFTGRSPFDVYQNGVYKVHGDAKGRLQRGDHSFARRQVADLLTDNGALLDDEALLEAAAQLMARAQADFWRKFVERAERGYQPSLDGDDLPPPMWMSAPPLPQPKPEPAPEKAKLGALSVRGAEAIKAIAKRESFPPKRIEDYEAALRTFLDFLEADPDLAAVTSDMAGDFMRALEQFPSNASKRLPYRDLSSFREKLAHSIAVDDEAVLNPTTVNTKYLTPLRQIYAWYASSRKSLGNPFAGISSKKPKRRDKNNDRRSVTDTEIVRLLSLPLFTGSKGMSHQRLYELGPLRVDDWRYWVPLIAMFSGMRLNEACGLGVSDVQEKNGIVFFDVRDEIPGQHLKSIAARRQIPVHSSLKDVGLLEFVAAKRAAGAIRLFEELEEDADGYFSGKASKFFADLRPRYIDPTPPPGKLTFHSIRHTVTGKLRAAQVRMDVSMAVIGHEQGETHSGMVETPCSSQAATPSRRSPIRASISIASASPTRSPRTGSATGTRVR
jgi:integrase